METAAVASLRAKILGELMFRGARLFATTIAVDSEGQESVLAYKREHRPIVFVGWHGHDVIHLTAYRILFGPSAPAVIMVLDDVKGRVLEHFGQRMNLRVISLGHDPESPQWARGVVKMIMLLRKGYDAMVAADGPHGPAREAKAGAALIAQRARGVIVPSSATCSRKMELRQRWDNHLVPMPFSRTLVHFGTPIDSFPASGPKPRLTDLQASIQAALQSRDNPAGAALQTSRAAISRTNSC